MVIKLDYETGSCFASKKHDIFPEKVIKSFILKETGLDVFLIDPICYYEPSYCVIENKYNGLIKFFTPDKYHLAIKSIVKQNRKTKNFSMLLNGQPGKNSKLVAYFGESGNFLMPPLKLIENEKLKDFILFHEFGSEDNFFVVQTLGASYGKKLYEIKNCDN